MALPGPLVIAHRGSSHDIPEHTLAAYRQAIDEGADGLECDVRLTRDGHLVCVHDRTVDRTSDGRGKVSVLGLQELSELDFASWREPQRDLLLEAAWEEPDLERSGVLTFERLLQVVLDAGRRVTLHVETKHPTRYAGLVEQKLVAILREHGVADPPRRADSLVTLMSFSPVALRRLRLLAPEVPRLLLVERRLTPLRRSGILPAGVRIAGPSIELLRANPWYVDAVHRRGHRVHVWTVDDPEDIELTLRLGVDGVITNRPAQVLQRLGRP